MFASLAFLALINFAFSVAQTTEQCGVQWQEQYAKLHANIIHQQAAQRYVLSVALEAGLADRLTGLVGEFMYAMFTKRAFLHITVSGEPSWDMAYDYPNFNATSPINYEEINPVVIQVLQFQDLHGTGHKYAPSVDQNVYYPIFLVNDHALTLEIFKNSDLTTYPPGHYYTEYIVMNSNRGALNFLFQNPFHKQELTDMGLKIPTAFACVFNYLFKLKEESCDNECQFFKKSLIDSGNNNKLRIGVHVRSGDSAFKNDNETSLALVDNYLHCMKEIAETRVFNTSASYVGPKYSGVVYFFMSDSLKLRTHVKAVLGENVCNIMMFLFQNSNFYFRC